jgi:predicted MFS family arabinose efflux permease
MNTAQPNGTTGGTIPWRTPLVVLIAGAIVVLLVFGLRASFALFLKPMSLDLGWGREVFALAMATQNLMWGVAQPFASAIAEKWGAGRVIAAGGIMYGAGIYLMAHATDPLTLNLSAGVLLGMAQAGGGLAVVLGSVGRILPANRRTFGLGVITAAGAAGQFTIVPFGQMLLSNGIEWLPALLILASSAVIIVLCGIPLAGKPDIRSAATTVITADPGLSAALRQAANHRGYWLLTLGFFVCGFHVAFVGVHLPAYLTDVGMSGDWGAWSLALIGLFNVIGSFVAGMLGDKYRKKNLLSILYLLRSLVIVVFIMMPVTPVSVMLFSASLGLLWLSTVPLTSGLVAQMFGTRYMGTLFGIVFLNHQIGSFLGVWLGGYFFDTTGSYMPVWWAGVALGIIAALVHWPIRDEEPAAQPRTA